MKILLTTPYPLWPSYSGSAVRTLNIGRVLSDIGHSVTYLSANTVVPEPQLREGQRSVAYRSLSGFQHFVNRPFKKALNVLLSERQDLVVAAYPYQAYMAVPLFKRHKTNFLYDAQNVEALRFARIGKRYIAGIVARSERLMAQHARAILSVSAEEQKEIKEIYQKESFLLPNGFDPLTFFPGPKDAESVLKYNLSDSRVALFCGGFQYGPNRRAARRLVKIIWPKVRDYLPNAKLILVGSNPPITSREELGIIVTGEVTHIAPLLRTADVIVTPLEQTGGSRLKIVEALACGKPVLSTPEGAAGLDRNLPGLERVEARDFTARLIRLLQNPQPVTITGEELTRRYAWPQVVGNVPWQDFAPSDIIRP